MAQELHGVRIEKDADGWVAVLPPSPDAPDEELGLPASTREEAEAEGRAYEAITQSSLYTFDFDETRGCYFVSVGKEGEKFAATLLADAYKQAQEAYAKRVSEPPPADKEPAPEVKPKQTRKRMGNGTKQPEPRVADTPEPEVLPPQQNNITSGIGNKPTQLQPPREDLADHRNRIDRLEMILVAFARTIIKEIKEGA